MSDRYIFINNAINDSIIMYCQYKDSDDMKNKEKFITCVAEMLCIIYGEENITNAYYNKDEDGFKNLIVESGVSEEYYNGFLNDFENYYEKEYVQRNSQLKRKNKFFNLVQKHIIDMATIKNNSWPIRIEDRKRLYSLLFTAKSDSFLKKTYALSTAYNPYEIDDYFKKQGLLLGD